MHLPHLRHGVRAVLDFALYGKLVRPTSALCGFCSSGRGFALGFLQIPPRDGHPCPLLTVPTAKPVADLHRRVIAHAEHTMNKTRYTLQCNRFLGAGDVPKSEPCQGAAVWIYGCCEALKLQVL